MVDSYTGGVNRRSRHLVRRVLSSPAMPKEIPPSSYECDCGYQLNFCEGTIWEMKKISMRKRAGVSDSRHGAIFDHGECVAIYCPKARRELPMKPVPPPPAEPLKPGQRRWTERQGQFLAFIHLYTKLNRRAPAEADIGQYFRVSPPAVHQMIVTLERKGLIERRPGAARSIRLRVEPDDLPELDDHP